MHFFSRHPVFRFDEFAAANEAAGRSRKATHASLRYHVRTGRLLNLRRGLYRSATNAAADPWVVGSKLADDAVLAWDAALSFYELTGLGHGMTIMTRERIRHFVHNEVVYASSAPPRSLGRDLGEGIVTVERSGEPVRVTTLERTLVDCLDRLDLGPGLDALWAAFAPRLLDGSAVVRAALQLGSQSTAARTGLFLHFLPKCTRPAQLDTLRKLLPPRPIYADRARRTDDELLLEPWNVRAPRKLLLRMERDANRLR